MFTVQIHYSSFVCGTASKCNETPIFIFLSRIAVFFCIFLQTMRVHSNTNSVALQFLHANQYIFFTSSTEFTFICDFSLFLFSYICTTKRMKKEKTMIQKMKKIARNERTQHTNPETIRAVKLHSQCIL